MTEQTETGQTETPSPAAAAVPISPVAVKAGTVVPFTPDCAKALNPVPVYHLRVPTLSQREEVYIEVKARGAYLPPLDQTGRVLRREILAHAARDRIESLLADVDAWLEAIGDAAMSAAENGEGVIALFEKFNDALTEMIPLSRPLAQMIAASDKHMALLPLVTLQQSLMDVTGLDFEGAPVVLERRGGFVTEESMSLIPRNQLREVMAYARAVAELSPATRKN
jgi:hypothetical protein